MGQFGPGSFKFPSLSAGLYDIVAETKDHHVGKLTGIRSLLARTWPVRRDPHRTFSG